jgi:G3E family GTPase
MTPEPSILIDVTIIGGYLGAGKTTLVNHLLPHLDGRTVVLVNDFGSIGIDGDLIAAANGDTITLANGCICCSMVDGLSAAIDDVGGMRPRPERLIIETSGVAEPGGVAAYTHVPGFRLDGIVVVVDAETIRMRIDDRYVGDVVKRQLAQADIMILNKADLLSADELVDCQVWLAEIVKRPLTIIPATHAQVRIDAIVGPEFLRSFPTGHSKTTLGTAELYTASFVSDPPIDPNPLAAWITELPAHIVRAKGLVRTNEGTYSAVQRVGSRVSKSPLASWPGGPSRMVLISIGVPCDTEVPPGFTEVPPGFT